MSPQPIYMYADMYRIYVNRDTRSMIGEVKEESGNPLSKTRREKRPVVSVTIDQSMFNTVRNFMMISDSIYKQTLP